MKDRLISLLISLLAIITWCTAQDVGIKTNFLYWRAATPNLSIEIRITPHWTIDLSGGYNFINPINKGTGLKWIHFSVLPKARYYLYEALNDHFFGPHGLVGFYNVNRLDIPIGRLKRLRDYRLQGWGYGVGIAYGYEWVLTKRWNLEASISAGYVPSDYTRYNCEHCGRVVAREKKNCFGPTRATLSLIYLF